MNRLCTILATAFLPAYFLAACSNAEKSAGGSVEDQEVIAVTDKTISGVTQKGPFLHGSSITIQELDEKTLSQTGNSYEGKTKNDKGEFSVKVAKQASPFALLKANGFYRNEVSGKKSQSPITLYAIIDLSKREVANVNLLTHLEYERSVYLAATDSMDVATAKERAEREVLASFGIEGEFANSEDLNIFGESDGSAALLAISVLMQGDLDEADFSERLANYASDIEEDGTWNDSAAATVIADWAFETNRNDSLKAIGKNIAGWEISADIPAFEKYVNNFWYNNFRLGSCNAKREGEVQKNANKKSKNAAVYFICRSGAWNIANDFEKDTYGWKDTTDGAIKKGDITDSLYIFDETIWRPLSPTEKKLGRCVKALEDTVRVINILEDSSQIDFHDNIRNYDRYFICRSGKWKTPKDLVGSMTDPRDGHVYRTIEINSQIWMAENLAYKDSVSYPSMRGKFWCGSDYAFGCYYKWTAAIDSVKFATDVDNPLDCGENNSCRGKLPDVVQGICPDGWHVPNEEEFVSLIESLITPDLYAEFQIIRWEDIPKAYPQDTTACDGDGRCLIAIGDFYDRVFEDLVTFWSSTEKSTKSVLTGDTLYYAVEAHPISWACRSKLEEPKQEVQEEQQAEYRKCLHTYFIHGNSKNTGRPVRCRKDDD